MDFRHVKLSEVVSLPELLQCVEKLNCDPKVHGLIVQLPLPQSLDESAVTEAVSPEKDVDG